MSDLLNKSGNPVSTPVTPANTGDVNEINPSGKTFNRSVSVIKASSLQGLRAKAKNFLPRPLYKFLVTVISSGPIGKYQLGKAINLAYKENASAWQKLGEYHALPEAEQKAERIYELQLACRKSDLELDHLQGLGDSPVAIKKQEVIELLQQCVNDSQNQASIEAYKTACKDLKATEYEYETLRLQRSELKTRLKKETKLLTPVIEKAKPILLQKNLEDYNLADSEKLTEDERKKEEEILAQGTQAYERLEEIKNELSVLEIKIRQYDNFLVDVDRAREALTYYENSVKKRNKGKE